MKVAIYARVSMDEKAEDRRYQEPLNQIEPLREWAKNRGWEVVSEYVDRWSGADPNREAFRRMLKDARIRGFDNILVWKYDRFSRMALFVTIPIIQKLRQRGIGIISMTESWLDTSIDNPMADLILSIMAWAAAEERRKISERTKLGILRRKNLGIYKGGRPVGSKDSKPRKRGGRIFSEDISQSI